MVKMEEIQAAMDLMMNSVVSLKDQGEKKLSSGKDQLDRSERGLRELVLRWFVETQASHILCDGNFPTWFHGFISRQEAEDRLRDKTLGFFLIRLSERACGYILSYKGQDRCRHFVINETKDRMLVVSGDSVCHSNLPALIRHFKITPIQPFGECLTSDRESESPTEDVYDVFHCKPSLKLGVSVQALRNLWDQRSDVSGRGPPSVPPKSRNRRLISSSSIERASNIQAVQPILKRNLPLRNSLSANLIRDHLSHGPEQHNQPEQKWSSKMANDEELNLRRTSDSLEDLSLESHTTYSSEHDLHLSTSDGQNNSHLNNQSSSSPHSDGNHSHPTPPVPPHQNLDPPESSSLYSSLVLFKEQNNHEPNDLPHTNLNDLQPNPLYQTSFGLCEGRDSSWGPHKQHEQSNFTEVPINPIHDPPPENTYQDITDQQNSNTYEDIPAAQHGKLQAQDNNTYEDIPVLHNNTYASVQELQPAQLGKKNHKWWKFLPESKKK